MGKLAMIAFGGNAMLLAGQKGSYEEQFANVQRTCDSLIPLLQQGYDLVIGHGNGPQVGNVLLQHEAGRKYFNMAAMPMDFCGAETQGSIAYMIESCLERSLRRAGLSRPVVSLVTRVEVSASDPAFQHPTKPVGPYYTAAEAARMTAGGTPMKEDPRGRGWRKVVASPKPLRVNNIDLVGQLARGGNIVITVGGGGIPVVADGDGFRGVEAVIDKDLASVLAAISLRADEFYILTDVPQVCINFNTPQQKALGVLSVADAERYLAEGQFAEGSMAPKVRAGIAFVKAGGSQCIITEAGQLGNPACGTRIVL